MRLHHVLFFVSIFSFLTHGQPFDSRIVAERDTAHITFNRNIQEEKENSGDIKYISEIYSLSSTKKSVTTVYHTHTYYERECETVYRDGQWEYILEPLNRQERARRFADVVKGINKTADKYVADLTIYNFPRTWNAFCRHIEKIDNRHYLDGYSKVCIEHWEDNEKALGYRPERDCRLVEKTRRIPTTISVPLGKTDKSFQVVLSGDLQYFTLNEEDKVEIYLHGDNYGITGLGKSNSYPYHIFTRISTTDEGRGRNSDLVTFHIRAVRKKVTPSNNLSVQAANDRGSITLKVDDSLANLSQDRDEEATKTVRVKITENNTWQSKNKTLLPSTSYELNGETTEIKTNTPANGSVIVYYELLIRNSKYFSGNQYSKVLSERVNFD